EQRDALLLLVPCADSSVAFLLKALRDLDRESTGDLYLLFGDEFQSAETYAATLATRLQDELTMTNEATGPEDEKLPPLPARVHDSGNRPAERILAGLEYARSLIEPAQGQHYIWGMAPLAITDSTSYLELLAQLPPKGPVLPWMRGARIVARVPEDFELAKSPLAKAKRIMVEPFIIPHDAHENELLATAADAKMPLGERMKAEVQLGYLDYAHGRYAEATDRFNRSLAFFQWAGIPAMEGLIISGLGDIARRQADWKQAQHWYACAVTPAAEAGNPILLSTIVQNLALVAYHEQRFADAEERYGELAELKRGMLDEVGLAEALEWRGNCQEKQGAHDRAVESWEEAALICKAFELHDRLVPLLKQLRRGYERLEMREALATFDEEWR
ncbi:MAG: hypothetical protein JNM56_14750, partial [Planctomycetia bacterium]|nr:hypothetical protein [Planctomycetia bacterium]